MGLVKVGARGDRYRFRAKQGKGGKSKEGQRLLGWQALT